MCYRGTTIVTLKTHTHLAVSAVWLVYVVPDDSVGAVCESEAAEEDVLVVLETAPLDEQASDQPLPPQVHLQVGGAVVWAVSLGRGHGQGTGAQSPAVASRHQTHRVGEPGAVGRWPHGDLRV